MTAKKQKLSDFRLQQRNANKHSPRGMGMLDNTIATDGFIGAITAAADGEVFDGSARLETSFDRFGDAIEPIIVRSNGDRPIIYIREDIPTADDPKAKVLSIAANRISELNYVPDLEILAEFSEEVDLSGLYFEDELQNLLEGLQGGDGLGDPETPPGQKPGSGNGSLSEAFLVPPFSVLDARQGYWQKRKKQWLDLGIQSELGRGGG